MTITHLAFIMDGNRRYGKKHRIENKDAYKLGLDKFLDIISFQVKYNIYETSFFALSHDNYEKRPENEKDALGELIKGFSKSENVKDFFRKHKIFVRIIGDIDEINRKDKKKLGLIGLSIKSLKKEIEKWNEGIDKPSFVVNIALNYDGHTEIKHAFKEISKKIEKGELKTSSINEKTIKKHLWFNESNAPEVIVRPGDAPRLSGFMLWDSKYSEIYLTKKLWPEIDESDFVKILDWYKNIKRNFGK